MSPPTQAAEPRPAASIVLMREGDRGAEVYMLRRHAGASFMSSAFVFPGGLQESGEPLRDTAVREVLEEAGVFLCTESISTERAGKLRDGVVDNAALSTFAGNWDLHIDYSGLHYYAHWITPSLEKRRYSATFFVARLPEGQQPSPDNAETTDEAWVRPADAVARAAELKLPPPQVRILSDLAEPASRGWDAIVSDAAARAEHRHPILPKVLPLQAGVALVLPWDPQYDEAQGEGVAIDRGHPLAVGPSRFVFSDGAWRNVAAPEPGDG